MNNQFYPFSKDAIDTAGIISLSFDSNRLNQILLNLHHRDKLLEEATDKLAISIGDIKMQSNTDALNHQLDEKIRQINITQSNTNEKIMQLEIQMHSVSEMLNRSSESEEKIITKVIMEMKDSGTLNELLKIDKLEEKEASNRKLLEQLMYEKIEKIEAKFTSDIEKINAAMESKLYDLENKVDSFKNTHSPKGSPKISNLNLGSPIKSMMPPKLNLDPGTELHQYATYLQKEIDTYKHMVEDSVQIGLPEPVQFTDAVTTYSERITKLESDCNQLIASQTTEGSSLQTCFNGIKALQHAIMEKLKIKIKIPGLDDIQGNGDVVIESVKEEPPKSKFTPPLVKSLDTPAEEEKNKPLVKPIGANVNLSQFATKECVTKFEQTIKVFSVSIGEKIDRQEFEKAINGLKALLSKYDQTMPILTQGLGALEGDSTNMRTAIESNRKEIEELDRKNAQSAKHMQEMQTELAELAKRLESKVDIKEVSLFKHSIDDISIKIQKLCEVLEDDTSTSPDSLTKTSSIKVTILKLDGRIGSLEKRMDSNEERGNYSLELEKQEEPSNTKQDAQPQQKVGEHIAIRAKVEKHENKLEELENRMYTMERSTTQKDTDRGIKELDDFKVELLKIEKSFLDFESMKGKLSHREELQIIEEGLNFKLNEVKNKITSKLEKKDLEKSTSVLKNKLQWLANTIKHIRPKDNTDPYPLFMYNRKCIFCNQGVNVTNAVKQIIGTRYTDSEYLPKEPHFNPKNKMGHSKLLNSIKSDWEVEQLFPRSESTAKKQTDKANETTSCTFPILKPISPNLKKKANAKSHEI